MAKKLHVFGRIYSEEEIMVPIRDPNAFVDPLYIKFVAERYDQMIRSELAEKQEKQTNSNVISKVFDRLDEQIGGDE